MKLKPKHLGKLVKITWLDSEFDAGWHYGKKLGEPNIVFSYGVITAITKEFVEVVATMGKHRGLLNPLMIPIGCVKDIKEFKLCL